MAENEQDCSNRKATKPDLKLGLDRRRRPGFGRRWRLAIQLSERRSASLPAAVAGCGLDQFDKFLRACPGDWTPFSTEFPFMVRGAVAHPTGLIHIGICPDSWSPRSWSSPDLVSGNAECHRVRRSAVRRGLNCPLEQRCSSKLVRSTNKNVDRSALSDFRWQAPGYLLS